MACHVTIGAIYQIDGQTYGTIGFLFLTVVGQGGKRVFYVNGYYMDVMDTRTYPVIITLGMSMVYVVFHGAIMTIGQDCLIKGDHVDHLSIIDL